MQPTNNATGTFPFSLSDLRAWVVRRKDGTITRFELSEAQKDSKALTTMGPVKETAVTYPTSSSLGSYCHHTPGAVPLFEDSDHDIRLWVADAPGARLTKGDFDFVIDGGDVLTWTKYSTVLEGDPTLVQKLSEFAVEAPPTRLLKIDWFDRKAPDLVPQFWTELLKELRGDVMTCCQGGHGRSGSSFVCLLLNLAPDYDALDAIVHLRAVHCPRAIESKIQHEYINDVAKYLGREPNALEAEKITDYKATFRSSTSPTAVKTRAMLGWKD